MAGDHIQEMRAKMEERKQRKAMNNQTSDQIYQNLALKVLKLLLEREHAKNAANYDAQQDNSPKKEEG